MDRAFFQAKNEAGLFIDVLRTNTLAGKFKLHDFVVMTVSIPDPTPHARRPLLIHVLKALSLYLRVRNEMRSFHI